MNNMILAGCMLTYSSVFLLGLDGRLVGEQVFPLLCSVNLHFCCTLRLKPSAISPFSTRVEEHL